MLPDVNLWLALTFEAHAHHEVAAEWFDSVDVGECKWCRLTQQGFLRLATNPSVLREEAVTLAEAWSCYDALMGDERVLFCSEPGSIETLWRQHTSRREYSPKVWNDAYLAAFAQTAELTLVTFDRGFTSFEGLRARVLSA